MKRKELKAQAAGWTYLSPLTSDVQWARACKSYIPGTAYGNLYKVRYELYRKNNNIRNIDAVVNRVGTSTASQYNWLYGVAAGLDIYASADLNDTVTLYYWRWDNVGTNLKYPAGVTRINPASLVNC